MTDTQPTNVVTQPTNVVAAIARVKAEIGGIEKLSSQEHKKRSGSTGGGGGEPGINYTYRSIEQIVGAVAPLLARYGVVIVPSVTKVERESFQVKSGATWLDLFVEINWSIYGPGGIEDVLHGATAGQGRDNSDKGLNKATTQAYKNLLLRLLDIGDPADEGEHQAPQRDEAPPPPEPPALHPAEIVFDRIRTLSPDSKTVLRELADARGKKLTVRAMVDDESWLADVKAEVEARIEADKAGLGTNIDEDGA